MDELFDYDLNLERIAIIRIAINLWEQPLMKNKIKSFLHQHGHHELLKEPNIDHSRQLLEWESHIYSQIENFKMPVKLKQNLLCAIRPVGENLFGWLVKVSYKLTDNNYQNVIKPSFDDYYDNICWHYNIGRIDTIKTFNLMYHNIIHDEESSAGFMVEKAIIYCMEYQISKLLAIPQVVDDVRKSPLRNGNFVGVSDCFYFNYWYRRYSNEPSFNRTQRDEELMCFSLAEKVLNVFAAKYFYERMNEPNKVFDYANKYVKGFFDDLIKDISNNRYSYRSFGQKEKELKMKKIDISHFFISCMSNEYKKETLSHYSENEIIYLNKLWRYYNLVSFDTIYIDEGEFGYEKSLY